MRLQVTDESTGPHTDETEAEEELASVAAEDALQYTESRGVGSTRDIVTLGEICSVCEVDKNDEVEVIVPESGCMQLKFPRRCVAVCRKSNLDWPSKLTLEVRD